MAVTKIKEIKNVDAFDAFTWSGDDFKKYNLIYGWNGSGKTTLSRLFNFLERKEVHITDLTSIEFTIQTSGGSIKKINLADNSLNVRVFNEDFVEENLLFNESQAKKIVILGKENITLQKEIEELEMQCDTKQKLVDELEDQSKKLPKSDEVLTKAGGEVTKQFGNTPLANDRYYGRSYDKSKVKKRIEQGDVSENNLTSLIIADPNDIDAKREIIKNEKSKIILNVAPTPDFSVLFANANKLLDASVRIQDIQELKDDKPLRDWVESGYKLHKTRGAKDCQFCHSNLPDNLLTQLGDFFTDELQKVKDQINNSIAALSSDAYTLVTTHMESGALFPESAREYLTIKTDLEQEIKTVSEVVTKLIVQLKDKGENLHNHSKTYSHVEYPKDDIEKVNNSLKKIEQLIVGHNKRVDTISEEVQRAAESIELHVIATTLSNKQYFQNKKEEERLAGEILKCKAERKDLLNQVKTKKASLHNASDAVEKINAILKEFFGESNIYLEVTESKEKEIHYVLKRRGKDAKYLSEGEESVLALVYFLIKLEEDGCNKTDCLIVVDDPVDSQDSNFLFRTFALLKRQLKDAGQLIVLTHNFEFFNLTRDWLISSQQKDNSSLYFISHDKDNSIQEVKIENLPALLKDYKSEYQYLFCRLYQFANDIRPLDKPIVANIARKILEYFAGFKWSCRTTEDFTNIVLSRFVADQHQLKKGTGDFVVKFLHEYSHGQDFSRPISASMLEAKPIAQNVLKFIELADGEHYRDLKTLCDSAQI